MRRQPQQTYFCPREQRKGDACTFDQRGIGSCDDAYGNRSCFTTNSYVDRPVIMCDDASCEWGQGCGRSKAGGRVLCV